MRTTNDLPTAVDFTNVLVNYLEVSPEDMPKSRRESERGAKPIPPPLHPPLTWREDERRESDVEAPGVDESDMREPPEEEIPMGDFRQVVPQALIDMDLPEDDPKYQQAVNVIDNVQGPPSLPLFLGRSILNGTLPMKDDSSVLTLPNHTVLNHLATSSIKNGVLATSVTTRYKKKVCQIFPLLTVTDNCVVRDDDHVQGNRRPMLNEQLLQGLLAFFELVAQNSIARRSCNRVPGLGSKGDCLGEHQHVVGIPKHFASRNKIASGTQLAASTRAGWNISIPAALSWHAKVVA